MQRISYYQWAMSGLWTSWALQSQKPEVLLSFSYAVLGNFNWAVAREVRQLPEDCCFFGPKNIWMFPKIVVPPNHPFLGFSIINHPFWGTLIFGNTHLEKSNTIVPNWHLLCFFGYPSDIAIFSAKTCSIILYQYMDVSNYKGCFPQNGWWKS